MREDFAGKTAIVTGGGTGLGLEISTQLGRRGARVVCASRDSAHHAELLERAERDGFEALSVALDVREPSRVKEVVRGLDRVDVLINNAAGNFIRPSMMLAPKAFRTVIDIALNGVFYMSRECGRKMREHGGAIVNISAPYAFTGKPGAIHSACAKAGVESMTKTLAAEWAEHGIRVNAVSPGPFLSSGAADRLWPTENLEELLLDEIPVKRLGTVEEIARVVCYAASDDAEFMTGSIIVADGGWTLPKPLGELRKIDRRRSEPRSP
ncbi:MAG: SDR family oxidoreductase [Planctomycetota bacterium]|jgi:NAD(P)-dependent dehydrogenase (short-subunit alcohol dehydrogenase family)